MPLQIIDHIALVANDRQAARKFYVTALGCAESPVAPGDALHVNIGVTQLQLTIGPQAASVWAGHFECWTNEPLETVHARLLKAQAPCELVDDGGPAGARLGCRCPHGNRFFLRRAPEKYPADAHGSQSGGIGASEFARAARVA